MTTETKRLTKDDWWIICHALEGYKEKMTEWSERSGQGDLLVGMWTEEVQKADELLTRLVNTKLSERDKYAHFGEYVEW